MKQSIRIISSFGPEATQEIETSFLDKKSRLLKAAQWFIGMILLSIAFIFIPVLHFVLVPATLVLAFFFSLRFLKHDHFLRHETLLCPKCANQITVEKKSFSADEGLKLHCNSCRSQIKVSL